MRDEILVRQAAPTLSGIKSGSLFPCPLESRRQLLSDIRCRNRILRPKGLRLLPLRVSRSTVLLYLYRPSLLARDLVRRACIRLHARQGYPVSGGPLCCLAHLTRKLRQVAPFPMRSVFFWATHRRMCRAFWIITPTDINMPDCGRYTAM